MKNLQTRCLAVALIGATCISGNVLAEQKLRPPHGQVEQVPEPRAPSEFEFGQYHGSSKMTPGGSLGPKTWGEERTVVDPPIAPGQEPESATSGSAEPEAGAERGEAQRPGARERERDARNKAPCGDEAKQRDRP